MSMWVRYCGTLWCTWKLTETRMEWCHSICCFCRLWDTSVRCICTRAPLIHLMNAMRGASVPSMPTMLTGMLLSSQLTVSFRLPRLSGSITVGRLQLSSTCTRTSAFECSASLHYHASFQPVTPQTLQLTTIEEPGVGCNAFQWSTSAGCPTSDKRLWAGDLCT